MNTETLQAIDPDLLETFFSHVESTLKQNQPDLSKILASDGPFLDTLFQDRSNGSSVVAGLDRLETLNGFLELLSRTVKEGLPGVRLGVLPVFPRKKFLSLPVEVVTQIFEGACDGDTQMCIHLALVSKQFRSIAINAPRLWTHLATTMNPKHYLERSKSVGLDILFDCDEYFGKDFKLFLQMTKPHASRWRSVSLTGFKRRYRSLFSDLRKLSPAGTFLALESLHVDYRHYVPMHDSLNVAENEQDPDKSLRHFFSTWRMPVLRTVHVVNLIPLLPSVSITCFRLELSAETTLESPPNWSLRDLISLFRSLHSLRELSIYLSDITFSDTRDERVELLQLKTLQLRTELTYVDAADQLLDAISTPNVSEVTVRIHPYTLEDIELQLASLAEIRWPCLESFDFEIIVDENEYTPDGSLDTIFTDLPEIQHLRISCIGIEQPSVLNVRNREHLQSPYPPLRTLELSHCYMFDTSFILSIKDIINSPEFTSLKIDECPLIEEEVVREMMPEGKVLEWKLSAEGANELRPKLARIKEEWDADRSSGSESSDF